MNHKEMNHKKTDHREMGSHSNPYARLLLMSALSFLSMYVFMYAMVNSFANALSSLNQFYMAGLMTAQKTLRNKSGARFIKGSVIKDKGYREELLSFYPLSLILNPSDTSRGSRTR